MDYTSAHVMEYKHGFVGKRIILSKVPARNGQSAESKEGETATTIHESKYFKELSDIISQFDEVCLFGPSGAKSDLHKLLADDPLYKDIKIVLETDEAMTNLGQYDFVKKFYFNQVL
jgi:hypothetical protein